MRRYESTYRLGPDAIAVPETFNPITKDLDDRLHAQEELRGEIEALRNTLLAQVATRIDEFILPALGYIQTIQQGGFLAAPIAANSAVAFEEGVVNIAIDQELKAIFRPTPFVALVRGSTSADWAVAQVVAYDEATGGLSLDIVSAAGDPGPHEDVIVSATSGTVMAQIAYLSDARAARDQAAGSAQLARHWAEKPDGEDVDGVGTRSAKHHAGVAGAAAGVAVGAAGEAGGQAGIAAGKASDAADSASLAAAWANEDEDVEVAGGEYSAKHYAAKAEASAAAAALFDPSSYYTKGEGDLRYATAAEGELAATAVQPEDLDSINTLLNLALAGGSASVRYTGALYDRISTSTIDAALSSGISGATTKSATGLETFTSNSDPAGFTFLMTPAPTVAGDEWKASDAVNTAGVQSAPTSDATWEITFPEPRHLVRWTALMDFSLSRQPTVKLEGYIDGAWAELDSYTHGSSATIVHVTSRAVPAYAGLVEKARVRATWGGGGAQVTFKDIDFQTGYLGAWVSNPVDMGDAYDDFSILFEIRQNSGIVAPSDFAFDLSRDDGVTWTEAADTIEVGRPLALVSGSFLTYSGVVDLSSQPAGSVLRYRIRQTTDYGDILILNYCLIRWS